MQRDTIDAVLVGNLRGHSDLFDGAGVVVAVAGAHQRNLRRVGFAGFDEKILADANRLALLKTSDVIDAVAIHLEGAVIDVLFAGRKLDLLSVVELDLAAWKWAVGGDFEFGLGADDGA